MGTAVAVTTEQRVSAAVQLVVAALAVATTAKAAVSKATMTATMMDVQARSGDAFVEQGLKSIRVVESAAVATWAATATATATVTRKWLTVTEIKILEIMDAAKPVTVALAMEEAAVAAVGVAAKMV
jgi:hypothetical protein